MRNARSLKKLESFKPLFDYCKKTGYRVIFEKKTINNWAFGWHCGSTKTISINLLNPNKKPWKLADLLFIFAHECRHIEHTEKGMFKKYYGHKTNPTYFICGMSAERDCDAFAKNWCLKFDMSGLLTYRIYPPQKVALFVLPYKLKRKAFIMKFLDLKDSLFESKSNRRTRKITIDFAASNKTRSRPRWL